jgi:hypothetical protein
VNKNNILILINADEILFDVHKQLIKNVTAQSYLFLLRDIIN